MYTYRYTCSDIIHAMARDTVVLSFGSHSEAYSEAAWQRVKRIFARRYNTRSVFVDITAVEVIEE